MDFWTGVILAVALCIALWVPFFIVQQRRGKAHGHGLLRIENLAACTPDLQGEAHPVRDASAIRIVPLIRQWRNEARQQLRA